MKNLETIEFKLFLLCTRTLTHVYIYILLVGYVYSSSWVCRLSVHSIYKPLLIFFNWYIEEGQIAVTFFLHCELNRRVQTVYVLQEVIKMSIAKSRPNFRCTSQNVGFLYYAFIAVSLSTPCRYITNGREPIAILSIWE